MSDSMLNYATLMLPVLSLIPLAIWYCNASDSRRERKARRVRSALALAAQHLREDAAGAFTTDYQRWCLQRAAMLDTLARGSDAAVLKVVQIGRVVA